MQHDDPAAENAASEDASLDERLEGLARRQMIKSAIAAVPIVLTITAGRARAQGGPSVVDSPTGDTPDTEGDEAADSEAALDASIDNEMENALFGDPTGDPLDLPPTPLSGSGFSGPINEEF